MRLYFAGLILLMLSFSAAFAKTQETVILIHGLMRTSLSMVPLKFYLEKQGYHVEYFKYHSPIYTLHEHAGHLQTFVQQIMAKNPDTTVHFVTHSMGGIIAREAVSNLNNAQFHHLGYIVMMAPPNQGSYLAKLSTKAFPAIKYFIKPLPELSSEKSAYVHQVAIPAIKMGIIAGRYDAKVPPASAVLQNQNEFAIVNSTHTFIMMNPDSMHLIARFLQQGTFTESNDKSTAPLV